MTEFGVPVLTARRAIIAFAHLQARAADGPLAWRRA